MKKVKILLVFFIVTCIMSVLNVNATSFKALASIEIPAMQVQYTTDYYEKTVWSSQYASKTGALDKLSGDERAIVARIAQEDLYWVSLPKGQVVELYGASTQAAGTYKLALRADKLTVSGIYFSGMWYLDNTLL